MEKVSAGKLRLEMREVELWLFLEEVLDLIRDLAAVRNLAILCEVEAGIEVVKADPGRLRQILLNLLSNAVKFNREAGRVTIRIVRRPEAGVLRFEVEDSGIGIPADKIPELFSEFFQVEGGYNRKYEGTGLGLALTRRLVELHGGRIWAQSRENAGSVFTFELPDPTQRQASGHQSLPV